jgi:hypothetical protein
VLKDQIDSLMADGWNDVPTLKIMSKDDMDTLQLSQLQRVRPSVPSLPVLDPANISSQSNKLWIQHAFLPPDHTFKPCHSCSTKCTQNLTLITLTVH